MLNSDTMTITTPNDREIEITRVFDAPRTLVFKALTTPELLKTWLLGPPGWTMTVCEIAPKAGSAYRFEWRKDDGTVMGMGGVLREVIQYERMVSTERFDTSWYPGEAVITQSLVEKNGRTTLTMTMRYESREARDMVVQSGATAGMGMGYDRLDELLLSLGAA